MKTKNKILVALNSMIHHLANRLNHKVNLLTGTQKKIALAAFTGIGICISICVIIFPPTILLHTGSISSLSNKEMQQSSRLQQKAADDAHYQVHRFKLYMDSLARAPGAKRVYDSLVHARPGLLDSIRQIEENYHSIIK